MSPLLIFSAFVVMLFTWIALFPYRAYYVVATLEKRYREYLVRLGGERLAREFFRDFQHEAITIGIDKRTIDATIRANREKMINELGHAAVEEVFGPSETLL